MKYLNLKQGTPAWHTHRAQHLNASDAPVMMGFSPYKTRTQLLNDFHTGLTKEVGAFQQQIFDDGHRFEKQARAIAEGIIGDDLYPVVGTEGKFSASFDGLTLDEEQAWEHKTLNQALEDAFNEIETVAPEYRDSEAGRLLPLVYRAQLEHQCLVSKNTKRVLFLASKWEGEELVAERHCWYYPDAGLREKILLGWSQFEEDLKNFKPLPVADEVMPEPIEALPALFVEVVGEVRRTNLVVWKDVMESRIAAINTDLKTDQDFATAGLMVKFLDAGERRLEEVKAAALSQTSTIEELFNTVNKLKADMATKRIFLEKLVTKRKVEIRTEIVQEGQKDYAAHAQALNKQLGAKFIHESVHDLDTVTKGLRSFDSARNGVSTRIASHTIEATAQAAMVQANLDLLKQHQDHEFLFPDVATIALKKTDDFAALVKVRIADHKAAEEKREAEAKEQREAEAALVATAQPDVANLITEKLEPVVVDQPEFVEMATTNGTVISMSRGSPVVTTAPTLKLGEIGTRLGFQLSADFLRQIGFEAVKERGACLYQEADFPLMCMRLMSHIQGVLAKKAA